MDKSLVNEKRYMMLDILPENVELEKDINPARIRRLNNLEHKNGTVVYLMNRDKRVSDNWALLFAQKQALKTGEKLVVLFSFEEEYSQRRFEFLINGLKEIEQSLAEKNVQFVLTCGDTKQKLQQLNAGLVVADFDPLKELEQFDLPTFVVDSHNVCPVWEVSDKKEYAARTFRPKIKRNISEYLTETPLLEKMPECKIFGNDWDNFDIKIDVSVKPVGLMGSESEAKKILAEFINERLDVYDEKRNDPNEDAQSDLSPYLSYGYISAQRVALEVLKSDASRQNKEAFLEELIVRKELSDNFCYYCKEYASLNSCDEWAKKTLKEHEGDLREYVYSVDEFEKAQTHDELWNAAQFQMVKIGKMHGYMRMYWAKKILEWSPSAKEALAIAIYLNDKYELDGMTPNGYVGCLWSIGGLHDRAWFEKPIYGKIRYMSYSGCKSKFNVQKYIKKFI